MNELLQLRLKKYVLWPTFDLEFEDGVTRIEGPNRSGKSVSFSAMTAALWGSAAAKRGTDASKTPKGSNTAVEFRSGKDLWRVEATGSAVQIFLNGKSKQMAGKRSGRTEFQQALGMSQELYDASVVLSSKPNPLMHASPLQRVDWFHSVFGLDAQYDTILKNVAPDLAIAKEAQASLTALVAEQKMLTQSLAKPSAGGKPSADMQKDMAKLRRNLDLARRAVAAFREHAELSARAASVEPDPKKRSAADLRRRITELEGLLRADDETRARTEVKQETLGAIRAAKRKLKKITRRQVPLLKPDRVDAVEHLLRSFISRNAERSRQWRDEARYRLLVRISKKDPAKIRSVEVVDADISVVEYRLEDIGSAKFSKASAGGVCLECGQKVTKAHLHSVRAKREKEYETLCETLRKLQTERSLAEAKASITVTAEPPRVEGAEAMLSKLGAAMDRQERKKSIIADLRKLNNELSGMDPRGPLNESVRSKLVDELASIRDFLNADIRLRDTRHEMKKLDDELGALGFATKKEAIEAVNDFSKRINKLEDTFAKRVGEEAVYRNAKNALAVLNPKVEAANTAAKNFPILEAIHKASDRSGLRMARLNDMVEAFGTYLNEAASLMWPDEHRFIVSHSDKGIDISLRRANELVSDLSVLSQSETQVWRLLCAFALVRMVPSRMRMDTIVLDELEGNMDEPSKLAYAKSFIPALANEVRKIIVISPMSSSELPIDFDQRYIVKPSANGSKLVRH